MLLRCDLEPTVFHSAGIQAEDSHLTIVSTGTRRQTAISASMAVWMANASAVTEAYFPPVQSRTLDGRSISLPADFPGERTLLILGFQRGQQPSIEAWAKGMHLDTNRVPWLQLPVMDDPNAIVRAIVNGGMRHAIHRDLWPHIVTLYTQKAAFERTVGIDSEAAVHVLVVDRNGTILARVTGDYTPEAAARLLAALQD